MGVSEFCKFEKMLQLDLVREGVHLVMTANDQSNAFTLADKLFDKRHRVFKIQDICDVDSAKDAILNYADYKRNEVETYTKVLACVSPEVAGKEDTNNVKIQVCVGGVTI